MLPSGSPNSRQRPRRVLLLHLCSPNIEDTVLRRTEALTHTVIVASIMIMNIMNMIMIMFIAKMALCV